MGSELQAAGGILDRIDYRRIRRLGIQLRNSPRPTDNWDVPPASLQGWIASYRASIDSVQIASESGLLRLLQTYSHDIRSLLSPDVLPAVERDITDSKTIESLIASAKEDDRLRRLDFESWRERVPSDSDLARVLVVELGVSVTWPERPKVSEETGLRRLKVGALIGQVALGGALGITNLALGAFGVITSVVGLTGTQIPLTVGLVASTYTGFNGLLSGIDKLVDALKK